MNKEYWSAVFTLSGAVIGAGILGLPFTFAKSGFLIGLGWLIFLGIIMTIVNLYFVEVTLLSKKKNQVAGYAYRYFGKTGKLIGSISVFFGIISALVAYLIGEGQSLAKIIPLTSNPLVWSLLFWFCMTLLLREGLKGLKRVETYGLLAIGILILGLFAIFIPQIKLSNLSSVNLPNFAAPIGVVLFALMGFTAIPEVKQELKGREKMLKKAVLVGSIIPIILYIIFAATFLGIHGENISEIATLSFGPLVTLLGIFTMFTSYLVLSFALLDTFRYDLGFSKKTSFLITSGNPLIILLIISAANIASFSLILGIGGVISAGTTGILIVLMNRAAKKNKKTEHSSRGWFKVALISAIFVIATVLQFVM